MNSDDFDRMNWAFRQFQEHSEAVNAFQRHTEEAALRAALDWKADAAALEALKASIDLRAEDVSAIKAAFDVKAEDVSALRAALDMSVGKAADAMDLLLQSHADASHGVQQMAESVGAEMAQYFESPSYDLMRGLLRPDVLPQSFATSSLQFPRWMQNLADATRIISTQYELVLNSGIDVFARESERQAAWIQGVKSAASPALSMFADELLASAQKGSLTPALAEGFGAQVLGYLNETNEAQTEEERVAAFQEFFVWFVEQFRRLPRTVLSAEGMLSIFFLLISLFDNHWLSTETDRHIKRTVSDLESRVDERLEKIEDGQRKILEELREVKAQKNGRVTHVVIESAQLREGPGKEYKALRVLPPNLLVEEIGREEGWVHVTFFDYPNGREAQGWVSVSLIADRLVDVKMEP